MITGILFKTEYFATFFLLIQTCDLVCWVGTFKYLHTSAFTWISFQMCKKEARDDKKEDGCSPIPGPVLEEIDIYIKGVNFAQIID